MDHVISGVTKFQEEVYPGKKEAFKKLANTQTPEVLFITCADSRIDPNLLTQMEPGELFICRNAGNVIPPHNNQTGGMTASIEYAVASLRVKDVILCGHTDCGAIKGALDPESLRELPHMKEWIGHCRVAVEVVKERNQCCQLHNGHLPEVTQENIVQQLQHLRTHPAVAAKLATNQLRLHGWLYNIESGEVQCYNESSKQFEPMEKMYPMNAQE